MPIELEKSYGSQRTATCRQHALDHYIKYLWPNFINVFSETKGYLLHSRQIKCRQWWRTNALNATDGYNETHHYYISSTLGGDWKSLCDQNKSLAHKHGNVKMYQHIRLNVTILDWMLHLNPIKSVSYGQWYSNFKLNDEHIYRV